MSDGEKKGWGLLIWSFLIILACVLVFIGWRLHVIQTRQKDREPVYGYVSDLKRNKRLCEDHAARAKKMRLRRLVLAKGEGLYDVAAADQEAYIAMLKPSLRLFTERLDKEGKGKREKAIASGEAFIKWAREQEKEPPLTGEFVDPTKLLQVLVWTEEEENKAIKELEDALEACRLLPWSEIKSNPAGAENKEE